jgi:signal peptidase
MFEVSVSEAVSKVIKIVKSLRAFILAAIVVLIIVGALVLYSGTWPPLVVVESNSMQHSNTESFIGTIDTGDMVILKKANTSEIRTYLDSLADGYQTYGEYGDVVIYKPYGLESRTPIIHRALLRMEYNSSGGGYDIPVLGEIPSSVWNVTSGSKDWHNLKTEITLTGIGYNKVNVRLNVDAILHVFDPSSGTPFSGMTPFTGLVTMGDNNRGIADQMTDICWTPVKADWISGVARGELPWFGLLKLWITGPAPDGPIPENSKTGLFVSLGLIIGGPIAIDVTSIILERKGKHPGVWLKSKLGLGKKSETPGEAVVPDAKEPQAGKAKTESERSSSKQSTTNKKKGKKGRR